MKSHEKKHEGSVPFPCHLCCEAFTTNEALQNHINAQHSEFACHLCPKAYKGKMSVKATTGVFGARFTKFINLVSLEPFQHKPMGMYASGPLKLAIGAIEPHLFH